MAYRSSPIGTEYERAASTAWRERISVEPPIKLVSGYWLWISDNGPPVVLIMSPPSKRNSLSAQAPRTAQRGLSSTALQSWVYAGSADGTAHEGSPLLTKPWSELKLT